MINFSIIIQEKSLVSVYHKKLCPVIDMFCHEFKNIARKSLYVLA